MKKVVLLSFVVLCVFCVSFKGSLDRSKVKTALSGIKGDPDIGSDCTYKGFKLYGKIEVVESFPDIKVQIVDAFPDLKVEVVEHFPDDCGKWQFVDAFPDTKVQFVDAFPDIKVEFVNSFPGLP